MAANSARRCAGRPGLQRPAPTPGNVGPAAGTDRRATAIPLGRTRAVGAGEADTRARKQGALRDGDEPPVSGGGRNGGRDPPGRHPPVEPILRAIHPVSEARVPTAAISVRRER